MPNPPLAPTPSGLPSARNPVRREALFLGFLFVLLLATHFRLVTYAWNSGALQGNEFRQTQTAISAYYIQKEGYHLAYPTPVLGKPWSIPMEFPLYEWAVVAWSNATHMPLIQSGRLVSLVCFYLTLPALFLLLGRCELPPRRRLLVLGMVLTCPIYIFYVRAFLIETMALMFAAWFLLGVVETLRTRRAAWLIFANLAGICAGLAKVTTLMVFLLPGAVWGILFVARAWPRRGAGWRPLLQTLALGIGTLIAPAVASAAWIRYSDALKAANPSAHFLTSTNLFSFNFGQWDDRFSWKIWHVLLQTWNRDLLSIWAFAALILAAILASRRWRKRALLCFGLFVLVQLIFPLLYALQDYYFIANAVLLMAAGGFVLCGVLESSRAVWARYLLVVFVFAGQLWLYGRDYLPQLRSTAGSFGGTGLTLALKDLTDPNDVLVVFGNDWSSVIPFYAQCRALMIRSSREHDTAYLEEAFRNLRGERVGALILFGVFRGDNDIKQLCERELNIDPRPVFTYGDATVYMNRVLRDSALHQLEGTHYERVIDVGGPPAATPTVPLNVPVLVSSLSTARDFSGMTPTPYQFSLPFRLASNNVVDGEHVFGADVVTRLWFKLPHGATSISIRFGILPAAWTREGGKSDGIEFAISQSGPGRINRRLFSRFLDPLNHPAERGTQSVTLKVEVPPGAELLFETLPGPHGNADYDWGYWGRIQIQ